MSIIKITYRIVLIFLLYFSSVELNGQSRHSWRYYFKKGVLQFNAEMYEYSILNFIKTLELNPEHYEAANYLSEVYYIKNRKHISFTYLKESLRINNNQDLIHNKIGEFYEFYHDNDLAFKHFKKAVTINPNNIKGNLNLVRHYLKRGNKELASRHFNISNKIGKKKSQTYWNEARSEENEGNINNAILLYKRCLKENPASLRSYYRLFELNRKKKNYIKAASYLETVKKIRPDYENVYISLGHLYFTRPFPGRKKLYIDKAIKNFKAAIKLNKKNIDAHHMLAFIYHYMKDDIKAAIYEKRIEELQRE